MKLRLTDPFLLAAISFAATAVSIVTAERASAQAIRVAKDDGLLTRDGNGGVVWDRAALGTPAGATAPSLADTPIGMAAVPAAVIEGGARNLRLLLDQYDGNVERAFAACSAGPMRVVRVGGLPDIAETHHCVPAILSRPSKIVGK